MLTKLFIPWKSLLVKNKANKIQSKIPIPDSLYIFQLSDSLICAMPLCKTEHHNINKTRVRDLNEKQYPLKIQQLNTLISLWNVIQHFYVYLDDTEYNWETFLKNMITKINCGIDNITFEKLLRKSLNGLNDRHIGFGLKRNNNLTIYKYKNYVLPIELIFAENKIVVSKINSKIDTFHKGDVILAINGKNIDTLINELLPNECSKSSILKLKKKYTESFLYNYLGDTISISLIRNNIISTKKLFVYKELDDNPVIYEVEKGYYYIDLSLISISKIKDNIEKLINAKGIIADSRYRTGGAFEYFVSLIIDEPVQSGNWYRPIFRYPNRMNIQYIKIKPWTISPNKKYWINAPVVFLSGHNCYSRGESNLEIVKFYNLGKIIGEATAGVNGDMNLAYIGNDYALTFTQLLVLNRDNSVFFGKGIMPDIEVKPIIKAISVKDDYLIKFAIDYLEHF